MKNSSVSQKMQKLIEGEHFYLEKGKYVFTGKFLSERGYCCKSGCRHCPYGFLKDPASKEKKQEPNLLSRDPGDLV